MGTFITSDSFYDHFDHLDGDRWQRGYWWQTDEQPFHPLQPREWFNPDNVRAVNSTLYLDLKLQPRQFKNNGQTITIKHSAGVICSKALYGYGYYEAKIRLSSFSTWDAFWLYGDTGEEPSEIDIMEQLKPTLLAYTTNLHITAPRLWGCGTRRRQYPKTQTETLSRDWHRYGLNWQPGYCEFYFDGRLVRVHTRKARHITRPARIILNTARYTGKDTAMQVDYVKYER